MIPTPLIFITYKQEGAIPFYEAYTDERRLYDENGNLIWPESQGEIEHPYKEAIEHLESEFKVSQAASLVRKRLAESLNVHVYDTCAPVLPRQRLFGDRDILEIPNVLQPPPKTIDVNKITQTPDGPRYADQLAQETLEELGLLNEEIRLAQSKELDDMKP